MDLDSLQDTYQSASAPPKSEAELSAMRSLQSHPTLGHMRKRMVIQLGGMVLFLLLVFTGLDGQAKPLYAQFTLVASLLLYALHEIWGLRTLLRPIKRGTLRHSLATYARQLRIFALTGWLVSTLAGASVIFFFTTTVALSPTKWGFVTGMAATLPILAWLNAQLYRVQRQHLLAAMEQLSD